MITVLIVEGLVHGAGALTLVWLLCGYVFWTLTEYWLHRIVFHFEPDSGIGAACTSSSTASTTIIPTIRCGS